jgi:hypothetical protein
MPPRGKQGTMNIKRQRKIIDDQNIRLLIYSVYLILIVAFLKEEILPDLRNLKSKPMRSYPNFSLL